MGKYVGDSLKSTPKFTNEELNYNGYKPEPGAGEKGEALFLNGNDKRISKRYWHLNKFNVVGMISHKKSLITIFGYKHKIQNFIKKFDIFHKKNFNSLRFWFIGICDKIANFESKLH